MGDPWGRMHDNLFPSTAKGERRPVPYTGRQLFQSVLAVTLLLHAAAVDGQTNWNAVLGGDWEVGSNWSSGVPTGAVTAVIDLPGTGPTLNGVGNTADLFVGRTLIGGLTIGSGGALNSSSGYLGFQAGSSGTVDLTGAGTLWSLKNLYLGGGAASAGGTGELSISGGSQVDLTTQLRIWTNGTLSIDGGGLETRDFIESGGTVDFVDGTIAVRGGTFRYRTGEFFKIDSGVSGKTAEWVLDGLANAPEFDSVSIGRGGLTVAGGTDVSATAGFSLGNGEPGIGALSIQGAGSGLTVSGAFAMTGGALEVSSGAAFSANSMSISNDVTIEVTGSSFSVTNDFESNGDLQFDAVGSSFQTGAFRAAKGIMFLPGDGVTDTWQASGTVRFGHEALQENEFLSVVANGMNLDMQDVIVGDLGEGNIGLSGDATWSATQIIFGNQADATLTTGNLDTAGHLVTSGDVILGAGASSNADIHIRSNGSTAQIGGDMIVGDAGQGRYQVSRSGRTDVGGNVVLGVTSPNANFLVLNFDSRMTVAGDLIVGQEGKGRLNIISTAEGAATLETTSAFLGLEPGSDGEALVDGADARWTDNGVFSVGTRAEALLTVSGGALLETGSSSIGTLGGSVGEARVTGSSTRWFSAGLEVGRFGEGALMIDSGALVQSSSADIAADSGSIGSVTVEGNNTGWAISNELYIGGESDGPGGQASLTIGDGATVTAGSTIIHGGGTLTGAGGRLVSDVVSSGMVAPGSSPGILTVDGDFSLLSGGTLFFEIDGLAPGTGYDQFVVTGAMDLAGGTIVLDFTDFLGPAPGNSFEFFPGQDLTGQTLNLSTLGLAPGFLIDTTSFAATGTFAVIPEPAVVGLLFGAGGLLLVLLQKRRRRGRGGGCPGVLD